MRQPLTNLVTLTWQVAVLLLVPFSVSPQASNTAANSASGTAWTPPSTPDGVPDLQGVWTNQTTQPL